VSADPSARLVVVSASGMIRAACVSESHNVVERAIILLIAVRVCSLLVRRVNDNSFALLAGYTRLLKDYNRLSYYQHKRSPVPVFDHRMRLDSILRALLS